ncbi:diguanylate cyclase domain-containing protein [Pararhizobium arenae]|uniref:diguanylate cyclase domain-containing protein n=1 Tax=Pararhizobium arenae TaxID=1856850 RepID=UPI0009FB19B3|nr:diguanylate cyclase [Pararhizobium arenae]
MGRNAAAQTGRRRTGRTVVLIHVACAALALMIVASLAVVLDRSVDEADRFGLTAERKLVDGELQHQIDAVVQYQAELSFWNKTYTELGQGTLSDTFIKEEMTDWLWQDFGFNWMIFSDRSAEAFLAVKDGLKVGRQEGTRILRWAGDLLEEADRLYEAGIVADGSGWRVMRPARDSAALEAPVPGIHATDIRLIDGVISIVVVQAVLPENLHIPAFRRDPVFMITIKPFSNLMLRNVEERLGISRLSFTSVRNVAESDIHVTLGNCSDPSCMVAAWAPRRPGSFVRSETLPSVIVIGLIATLVMTFIALRFGAVVSALEASEAENRHQARHDRLTGLINRTGFDQALAAATLRVAERPFSLLCIDLDRFKAVNDTYGHPAGDALLKVLAERFTSTVGDLGIVARLGGDEFAVLLDHGISQESAMQLARALIVDAQTPVPFDGQLLCVGCSVGLASAPKHGVSAREIVPAADRALYRAKANGRNCVRTADDVDATEQNQPDGVAA